MLQINIFFKWVFWIIICVSLNACFQSENEQANSSVNSAIEVKDATKTLTLTPLNTATTSNTLSVSDVYNAKRSNVFIEGSGQVVKLLADDNKGSHHQKFLVKVATGQTLLFAHNIDLAPRIESLQIGDAIAFRGEYVYNPKGGVMHWTHRDPKNQISGGWIVHNNQQYQ
jgi:hypothetical protein